MNTTPEQIRETCMGYLDLAGSLQVKATEDEHTIDTNYLQQKATLCANYMERLSDMSLQLAKLSLDVRSAIFGAKGTRRLKEVQLRESEAYKNCPRDSKTSWLLIELQVYTDREENWVLTDQFLRETREAINDRIQMIKRLDSDLRLQEKLLDAGAATGASSTPRPEGPSKGPDLERKPAGTPKQGDELEID